MQKATRQQTKDHNTRLVLKTIFDQGELSRADIARRTRLTRPTVSTIVAELLANNYVVEAGLGPSVGGKPPTNLAINQAGHHMICLDLSGAEFQGALIDMRGTVVHRVAAQLDDQRGETAVAAAAALIASLQSVSSASILGIAIGTPGLVDPQNGVVLRAVNLGWLNLPLRDRFEDQFGLPVHIANDSHLAALAEYTYGPPRSSRNLIAIRVGQGIGAGIVLNGQPFYGDGFGAGEIGHVVVAPDGDLCSCGNRGCLETTSSTRVMLRQAQVQGGQSITDWSTFAETVQAGQQASRAVAANAGGYLGAAVANLVGAYNIQTVVLAGRVGELGGAFIEPVRSEARRRVLPTMADQTTIAFSTLGSDIILLGASALLLQQELGII